MVHERLEVLIVRGNFEVQSCQNQLIDLGTSISLASREAHPSTYCVRSSLQDKNLGTKLMTAVDPDVT